MRGKRKMKVKRLILGLVIGSMLLTVACNKKDQVTTENTEQSIIEETETMSLEASIEKEVETAVGEFEYACQTSDVDAMIDCLDPGFAQALKSGRLLLNWMSTKKNNDEIIMDTMLISVMNVSDVTVDFSTMNIKIEEINIKNDVATVNATMIMSCSSGEYRDKVIMRMSKESGKWYITGVES